MKVEQDSLQVTTMIVGHRGKRYQLLIGQYTVITANIYLKGTKTVGDFRSRLGNLARAPRKSLSAVPSCLCIFLSRFHNLSNKSLFFCIAKLHGSENEGVLSFYGVGPWLLSDHVDYGDNEHAVQSIAAFWCFPRVILKGSTGFLCL